MTDQVGGSAEVRDQEAQAAVAALEQQQLVGGEEGRRVEKDLLLLVAGVGSGEVVQHGEVAGDRRCGRIVDVLDADDAIDHAVAVVFSSPSASATRPTRCARRG